NNLVAGTHTIDVKDANGCIFSTTAAVNNTTGPTAIATTHTDATCATANGTLTLGAVTGGVAPYTYAVDGSAFTATTIYNNLAAGTHTIDVKDANGCVFATTVDIAASNGPTAIAVTIADAACGVANGSITLGAVTGGVAPYTYSVDGSAFTATTLYNNLAAGTHTIDVKDANGCVFATTAAVNNTTGPTAIVTTHTDATCATANGTLTLGAVTGGVAPYTYAVDGSAFTATTVYNNLAAGTHTIDVKDANGCVFSTTAAVNNTTGPTAIATTHTDATCGLNNGTLTLGAVTGGVAPYTYAVDGSAFTATTLYNNLAAGTHTIDVKDANGCVFATTAALTGGLAPNLVITNPAAVCAPGTVDITAAAITNGSTAGLTYTYWRNAAATLPLINASGIAIGGTYYIRGTTAQGCSVIKPVTVTINPLPTAILSGGGTICEGSGKTLTVTMAGTAPFQLVYTDGTNSFVINSINSNTYQLTVAPAANTTYTISSISDAVCSSTGNGSSATISVEPAVPGIRYPAVVATANVPEPLTSRILGNDYTYNWTPPAGLSNPFINNPIFTYDRQTQYLIEMTSAAGCITVDTLLVKMLSDIPTDIQSDIFVPKAWSPNNDGHNDKLFPIPVKIKELVYFRIFNRWGQLVFETNILLNGWDGIFHGQPQVMDTYTWTLEAIGEDGKYYKRAGNSVLIR
ncbi:MAG: gliding motility-associated C-terminal domain-containing protein, partial [Chitinophagaceae bacterium]